MQQVHSIKRPIAIATEVNKLTPIAIEKTKEISLSNLENDACNIALREFSDLVTEEYWKWYCKMFNRVGESAFRELAIQARSGKDPKRYFSFLLKKHT